MGAWPARVPPAPSGPAISCGSALGPAAGAAAAEQRRAAGGVGGAGGAGRSLMSDLLGRGDDELDELEVD